ncbi:DJ-1/PfpI family protein [Lactiplantibacillus plantarum]|nr:DJ-1/PfpI family protein [Lactiplantibacillus plantarum]MCG0598215.1 DJ-1/PfpI family protein [Lactiplantibacillus plantarum]MCG0601918.1 DJ-1/PfpI family protein [Lactiplantibacillus plantarum]MCG0604854.1 DJ-1/PfpI family protein [Lactiplantibacillus plantarum]MCG0665970.1 DJ-1/PfpI family protein [Lactiplantibacillus plantarum]
MGNQPCIADPYLFVMTNRMKLLNYSFEGLPNLKKLDEIMRQHPAVKRVLEQEGAPHTLTDKN